MQLSHGNKSPRKTVLITGASSGFGLEFAKIFAREHYDVILIARPRGVLKKIAKDISTTYGVRTYVYEADLSVPKAADNLENWVKKEKLTIDCLINNVGIGIYGKFVENSLDRERELIQLNITLLTELCHKFIPGMIQKGGGHVLNIASIAAFQPGPYYATYFASKAYVLLFSEALALEYENNNVVISALCPGPASTRFFEKAQMSQNSLILKSSLGDPKVVAEAGYEGLMKGKQIIIPGLKNKVISSGYRILSRRAIAKITQKIIENAARG